MTHRSRWTLALVMILSGFMSVSAVPVTTNASTIIPASRCGVIVEPFPLTDTQQGKRPQITYVPARDEVYAAVTLIDPTAPDPNGGQPGVALPTLWRVRPWQRTLQIRSWLGDTPLRQPDEYPTNLYHVPIGVFFGVLRDYVALAWVEHPYSTDSAQTETNGIQVEHFPATPDPNPIQILRFTSSVGAMESRTTLLANTDSSVPDQIEVIRVYRDPDRTSAAWGYRFTDGWTGGHPYLTPWLIREPAQQNQPYTTTVHAPLEPEAPALATSGNNIAYAALTELRDGGERRIGIWQFDPTAIVIQSVFSSYELRPPWQRWGMAPGWATEPFLAFHGTTMLLTYRDATDRPMLAWTTTDAPDGWQVIALDDQAAIGQIHLMVDAPRARYVAVWARRGTAMDEHDQQLVIMHGLLSDPAVRTTPVAMTEPGPWGNPQATMRTNGTIHLVADYAPADGRAMPYLLTVPVRWDGPATLPAQPTQPRTGVLTWDSGVARPAQLTVTFRSAAGSVEFLQQSSTTIPIAASPLPAGPALVTGTWNDCDGLPLGSVEIVPPPTVTYTEASLGVAQRNPTDVSVQIHGVTPVMPLTFTGEVQVQDAAGTIHRGPCRTTLTTTASTLTGSCPLPRGTAMASGDATITVTGTLEDSLGQPAALSPGPLSLTGSTRYEALTVFIPTVLR